MKTPSDIGVSDFPVACSSRGEEVAVSARVYQPATPANVWLILAPGAGAGHDSSFMVTYARALAARDIAVVTFNFPYIEAGRRVPDPPGTLESCWKAVIGVVRERAGAAALLVAGGKSMGGRIASQVAAAAGDSNELAGLVFLGYPLHPPGRPDQRRTAHWPEVRVPALFVQGSRDPFASPEELREDLPRFGGRTDLVIADGGDHSFTVTRAAGRTQRDVHATIQDAVAQWISGLRTASASADPPATV